MLRRLEVIAGGGDRGLFEIHRFHDEGWQRECCLSEDKESARYVLKLQSGVGSLQVVCSSLAAARVELDRLSRLSREHFEHLIAATVVQPAGAVAAGLRHPAAADSRSA